MTDGRPREADLSGVRTVAIAGRASKVRAESLSHKPKLVALVANETAATRSYLAIKEKRAAEAGCAFEVVRLGEGAAVLELTDALSSIKADAIIVQLPLPVGIDTTLVCDEIPLEKDADVLSSAARAKFTRGEYRALPAGRQVLPPVVGAVREVLAPGKVELADKKAVVVGEGWLVGKPCATWLGQQGAQVAVVDINTPATEFAAALLAADIIVSGAGSAGLIKPEMIKERVVLIDAGTSGGGHLPAGRQEIVGDADPACASKCSLFTPVPGGMGPIAVALLYENAVKLAAQRVAEA